MECQKFLTHQPSKILGLKLQVCEVRATLRNNCFHENCILLHQHLDISRCKNPAIIINFAHVRSTITICPLDFNIPKW
jgi:hypothetical protein